MKVPEWPTIGNEAESFFANARKVAALWKAKGVSKPFILAMVAQAEAESTFDPNAKGDWIDTTGKRLPWAINYPQDATPTSLGEYQRKQDRLKAIKAATGIDIATAVMAGTNTHENDVDAAWWELENLPWTGKSAIEKQQTAYMASWEATALFEKAGEANAATTRANMAERWSVWFHANGGL